MHSTDNLDDGYLGSGKLLGYSRQKHGDENHKKEILEFCSSREDLQSREKEVVCAQMLCDPLNMNLKVGGEGGGKLWNEEHAAKFHRAGWKSMTASISSAELSERSKKLWEKPTDKMLTAASQKVKAMTLAATSVDANNKRKVTFAKHKHSQGEKNSQFGSCWVTDGVKPTKIKLTQLDEYLTKGFKRGRKKHGELP